MPLRPLALLPLCLALALPALAADRDISKVNGHIEVADSERAGSLETVNGSIEIGTNARAGSAETVNGSIRVGSQVQVGGLETVNGSIRVDGGTQVNGDIETVNGSVFVDRGGNVRGSVSTVNGAIGLVDTDVGAGIETVNGNVTVGIGSHVRGGLHYTKPGMQWINLGKRPDPRVVIGPDAVVDGPLVFERKVELYVHDSAKIGPVRGATPVRFSTPTPPESR